MPRHLSELVDEETLASMPSRTDAGDGGGEAQDHERQNQLNPYTQTLSLSNLDSCTRLEDAAFPPNERATREKLLYRLKHCGELSLGVFTSQEGSTASTAETSAPVYSGAPERKSVLLGHIVATKTANLVVTDADMAIPTEENPNITLGHQEEGRTVCVHSLAVLPAYQKQGLGPTLVKAYLQRIEGHGVADRVALIAHDYLIPFYERLGFENKGKSQAQFGGGGWYDMVFTFNNESE